MRIFSRWRPQTSLAGFISALLLAVSAEAATITVTSSADAGGTCPGANCSLRQAIATAAPGDTIFFNPADGYDAATQVFTIRLTTGELAISKNLTIDGGANKIVVVNGSAIQSFRIFNVTSGTVTIARLTIAGGRVGNASEVGGGVQNAGNLTLSACTISSNTSANSGGGVFNSGTIVLSNCTVANNSSGTSGGSGVKNVGNATLNGCTIIGNTQGGGSNVGAGVANSGTVHVRNTVIAGNSIIVGPPDDVAGNFLSDGFNFIGVTDGSTGFGATGSHDQTGTKAGPIDPRLSALRDNGGPTKTMAPTANSTLIDQGNSGGLTADQRGDPRPVGSAKVSGGDGSDIGAVERGLEQFPQSGTTLTVTNTDEHNEHNCRVDDCTLAEAIEIGDFLAANASTGPITIKFAPGLSGVILNTTVPTGLGINQALNIIGPGARVLTISGNNVARVFNVTGGTGNIVNISGLTIANANSSGSGGGLSNSANLTLRDCAVLNNAGGSGGGAVNSATMRVTNCTFAGNRSTGNGGALRNVGDLVVTNSTFNSNTAVSSGAIASFANSGPAMTLNIINCTISGNTASDTSFGTGGGILNGNLSTGTVSNTIVANNTAATGTDVSGAFTSGGHNLIRIATGSTGFINGNNGDQVGIPAGLDATLKNNGGPTDTIALLSGSTAINNGGANAPSTDQRGAARVGVSDIGAFEFNGIPPAPPTVTTNAATNVGTTSATLNATANPNGLPTSLQFTSDFTSFAPQDAGSGTASVPFSVNVTGLTPNTTYHFNAVAMSNGVTVQGVQQTFTTLPVTTLANISGRLPVGTGDNALFAGFIVTGTQQKKVIIRGIGPSLFVAGRLADPTLELHDGSGALLQSNDNWKDSANRQAIIDSGVMPTNDLESAIAATLPASPSGTSYTAIVRGAGNATGIGVVDLYDLDRSVDSKLANISNRGFVQTGDNVLFAGMIVLGQATQKVIIRALGPSVPVSGAMADPTLELHDGNGALLETNDNWVDSPNKQAIIDSTIPPPNNAESAIVRTLSPASYTAIVRGTNNTTGIAVVEVYALQ